MPQAYDITGTLATTGAKPTDIHTALRGRTPGQSEASTTTVVAFANRTRDGIKVPEVMKDGVTPALTNPGDGGRSDAVNVVVPRPMAFAQNQLGEVRTNSEVMGTVNTNQNASGRNTPMVMQAQGFTHSGYSNKPAWITGDRTDCLPSSGHGDTSHQGIGVMQAMAFTTEQTPKFSSDRALTITKQSPSGGGQPQCVMAAMAVRRLTPRECERLQGFPDDYTAIEYRKKPAADGPRYKALGNSMAVPVMRWIGERILRLQ